MNMEKNEDIDRARYVVERKRRLRVVAISVPAFIGILLGLWTMGLNDEYLHYQLGIQKEIILLIVVFLLGMSGLATVMAYLQTGFKRSAEAELYELEMQRESGRIRAYEKERMTDAKHEMDAILGEIQRELEKSKNLYAKIDDSQRNDLIETLKEQLTHETASLVLSDIKAQVALAHSREMRDQELISSFDDSRSRLNKELEALSRRGNLNLGLGAVTTVIGLVLLGLSVFSESTETKDTWAFVSHFLPRLTLVILIELFAYFFLSLYKSSLSEIKYFQNELTNIEAKQLALRASISYGDKNMVSDIVEKLSATERNHVLSKDQTTVELEKAKIEKETQSEVIKHFADLLPKKS